MLVMVLVLLLVLAVVVVVVVVCCKRAQPLVFLSSTNPLTWTSTLWNFATCDSLENELHNLLRLHFARWRKILSSRIGFLLTKTNKGAARGFAAMANDSDEEEEDKEEQEEEEEQAFAFSNRSLLNFQICHL